MMADAPALVPLFPGRSLEMRPPIFRLGVSFLGLMKVVCCACAVDDVRRVERALYYLRFFGGKGKIFVREF